MGGLATQYERDQERQYEFEHRHSRSRSERGISNIAPHSTPIVIPQQVQCRLCGFTQVLVGSDRAADVLKRHIRDHQVSAPVLIVAGRSVARAARISRSLPVGAVRVEAASTVEVSIDGGSFRRVTEEGLGELVAGVTDAVIDLKLLGPQRALGASASREFRLTIRIPDREELELIDQSFLKWLGNDSPTEDSLLRFADETEGLCSDYRDGLHSYVTAVMVKDRLVQGVFIEGDAQIPLTRFSRSAGLLSHFEDRSVGATVAACSRLNLNDFALAGTPTGAPELDRFAQFVSWLSRGGYVDQENWPSCPDLPADTFICPVDESTRFLIDATLAPDRRDDVHSGDSLERVFDGSLTEPDRLKLAAVLGERAYRAGKSDDVSRASSVVVYDKRFKGLAERWQS